MHRSSCLSQLAHSHGQAHNWTQINVGMTARSLLWLHRGVRSFLLEGQREEGSRQTKLARQPSIGQDGRAMVKNYQKNYYQKNLTPLQLALFKKRGKAHLLPAYYFK